MASLAGGSTPRGPSSALDFRAQIWLKDLLAKTIASCRNEMACRKTAVRRA
jgi:hypothetical protein